jgi:hypothetical protein
VKESYRQKDSMEEVTGPWFPPSAVGEGHWVTPGVWGKTGSERKEAELAAHWERP